MKVKKSYIGEQIYKISTNLIESNKQKYWYCLGSRIAGPAVVSFYQWICDELEKDPSFSDVIFVARDGYLLKKMFDKHSNNMHLNSHYVYASRLISQKCGAAGELKERLFFKKYIEKHHFGKGKIAIVDTNTNFFSAQSLIKCHLANEVEGLYWMVTNEPSSLVYKSFQKEHCYKLYDWAIMEMVFSSPEPPVAGIDENGIVFNETDLIEIQRQENFNQIMAGALDFADIWINQYNLKITNNDITQWINCVLMNPSTEDLEQFDSVFTSTAMNHDDIIKMQPFKSRKHGGILYPVLFFLKQKLWKISRHIPVLYKTLHGINMLRLKANYKSKLDTSPLHDSNTFVNSVKQYDIISFDVFDTLIRRKVELPVDIFRIMEQQYDLGKGFFNKRILAEERAREKKQSEVTLSDIYSQLNEEWKIPLSEIMLLEIQVELDNCFADAFMLEVYTKLLEEGKKIIAVSDMYLSHSDVLRILHKCGFSKIDEIFVSSEFSMTKAEGSLFDFVISCEGKDKTIVHIGDSWTSDYVNARKKGIDSIWYYEKRA